MQQQYPTQRDPQTVRSIAVCQKAILVFILIYFSALVLQFALPPELRPILGLGVLAVNLVTVVFVFLLCTKVYSIGWGIFLGLLTFIPLISLVVLLVISNQAARVLREHGLQVGLLGVDLKTIH